jgi:hypothetical protein
MRAPRRILALALAATALGAAGCGGDEEGKGIPQATATGLQAQLDGVQRRIDQGSAGACKDILEGANGPNKQQVQDLIDSMPRDVDADVKSALQDSFDNLWDLVEQECEDKASEEEETNTTPTETDTTPTETQTETAPPETETETETTPTQTTPPSEEELPEGEGNGNGGGAVPGTGNGGGVGPSNNKKEKKK